MKRRDEKKAAIASYSAVKLRKIVSAHNRKVRSGPNYLQGASKKRKAAIVDFLARQYGIRQQPGGHDLRSRTMTHKLR